ncbi:MAG: YkgJ family cysteine cluster protein [Candidatus Heimdallarchaeaceae archaeon]
MKNTPPFFYCEYSNRCHECCKETEMTLLEEDISRIEKLGYKREEFLREDEGFLVLRNIEGECFFLKDGKCLIYENRPKGCRYYPLILDFSIQDFDMDDECPRYQEFKVEDYEDLYEHVLIFVEKLLEEKEERAKK